MSDRTRSPSRYRSAEQQWHDVPEIAAALRLMNQPTRAELEDERISREHEHALDVADRAERDAMIKELTEIDEAYGGSLYGLAKPRGLVAEARGRPAGAVEIDGRWARIGSDDRIEWLS